MSQIASPGTPPFELLACDVVAVGDSIDLTAGAVCTRGVIVAIASSSLVISRPATCARGRPTSPSPAPTSTASPGPRRAAAA